MYAKSTKKNSSEKGSSYMIETKKSIRQEALTEYQGTRHIIRLQHKLGQKHIKSTLALLERSGLLGSLGDLSNAKEI